VQPAGPALVLGSTQPDDAVDREATAAAGIDVVRRRSGGGAVLVGPGEVLWIDVFVPATDPRWERDVGRATHWVGAAWSGALGSLGVAASWHDGPLVATRWSALVCFAGLAPGEVRAGGAKVVGISQRRVREGTALHCAALLRWEPWQTLRLLALDAADRDRAAADLAGAATPVGVGAADLETAVLDRLTV
jgi:lipoate-protein ligase A